MRGGALPLLGWAALLAAFLAVNWIWTDDTIQVASFGFAVLITLVVAGYLALDSHREALRRGPPPPAAGPEAVPAASLGAALAGIAVAAVGLGLAFGRFLVFFGLGLLIVALGRLVGEVTAQRREWREWLRRGPR